MNYYTIIPKKPNANGGYAIVVFADNEKVIPVFLTKEEAKKALEECDDKKNLKVVEVSVFIR